MFKILFSRHPSLFLRSSIVERRRSVDAVPVLGQLPVCFVQATGGLEARRWTVTPSNIGSITELCRMIFVEVNDEARLS
jgi:hypothetical protein